MSGPNGEPQLPVGRGEEDDDGGGFGDAEYAAINSMLDQINSCLDHLEEKNDHLHARLKELLESNRQTRLEFQQQLSEGEDLEADGQGSEPDT
ncbi:bublin coiled-coil protein [Tiliqua scincoides]|uniref:bublin coiled-coil protein n=1 Tax=Tiliqua scincoides TaxID=71010 RepID=UPI0034636813